MKKLVKKLDVAAALIMGLGLGTLAHADGGPYLGGSAGHTLSGLGQSSVSSGLVTTFSSAGYPLTLTSTALSQSNVDWSAQMGYMFNSYVGLELSYLNLGAVDYQATGTETTGSGTSNVNVVLGVHTRGPALSVRGILPLAESWFLDLHLGVFEGRTRTDYTTTIDDSPTTGNEVKTTSSLLAQLGTGYVIASHLTLHVDLVYLDGLREPVLSRKFNVEQVWAGLSYGF